MPIFNLYSKRQRAARGEMPDVYVYDDIPLPLRIQIIQIWLGLLGPKINRLCYVAYKDIVDVLCHEYGVYSLSVVPTIFFDSAPRRDYCDELIVFFEKEPNIEKVIDVIEVVFGSILLLKEQDHLRRQGMEKHVNDAIDELNARFREHGVGYQFDGGLVMRIDSQLIHSEVVKPALYLLNTHQYFGAQEEFLKAYDHYRRGQSKAAVGECSKSLESLIKTICDKRGWDYEPTATAGKLIQICFEHNLIPDFWQSHFSSLKNLLVNGIPVARNKLSAHGQGANTIEVPEYLVAYMLHMTASTIVFLCDAEAALER